MPSGYTTVSAQILDPAGNIYIGGQVVATFVNQSSSSTLPLLSGSVFQTVEIARADSTGNFTMTLADNNQIVPTPSQWQFTILDRTGTFGFNTKITITGASQTITAQLQAASVPLNPLVGGSFSVSLVPTVDNAFDLGSASFRWHDFWLARNLILAGTGNPTIANDGAGALTFSLNGGATIWNMAIGSGGTRTIVGRDTTDALTNKNLIGASSGNKVSLIDSQGASGAITGTGADATLFTKTLSASQIEAGKGIRITAGFLHNSGTASVTYKIKYGATVIDSLSYANFGTTVSDKWEYTIMNNTGVQNAQTFIRDCVLNGNGSASTASQNTGTSAADFSTSAALALTFNVAATDQVTPKFWLVELIQ